MSRQLDIVKMRPSKKLKTLLAKAQELNDKAIKFKSNARNLNMKIKNIKGNYLYQRYIVDSTCTKNCGFRPIEEQELNLSDSHQEILTLNPYSVQMIILTKKPSETESASGQTAEQEEPRKIENRESTGK